MYDFLRWTKRYPDRTWAAIVRRDLRFSVVNRVFNDRPPSWEIERDYRKIFLFRTGDDRDRFVEIFNRDYGAKAYAYQEA